LNQRAAARTDGPAAPQLQQAGAPDHAEPLLRRFHQVRNFTAELCRGLEPEDCVVQSMADVSPTKWHLAHTTWFFETFVLKKWLAGYESEIPEYSYLFNSYYNAAGDMHRRDLRGLISRPTVKEAQRYRSSIDSHVENVLASADAKHLAEMEPIITLGINHEQQHQELLLTDIKHVFAQNPLHPVLRESNLNVVPVKTAAMQFVDFDEAMVGITVLDLATTMRARVIALWCRRFHSAGD
jgi:hypothetical protein